MKDASLKGFTAMSSLFIFFTLIALLVYLPIVAIARMLVKSLRNNKDRNTGWVTFGFLASALVGFLLGLVGYILGVILISTAGEAIAGKSLIALIIPLVFVLTLIYYFRDGDAHLIDKRAHDRVYRKPI